MSRSEKAWLAAGGALGLLCCNAVYFGHYADDLVWFLLSEGMLHGSLQAAWSHVPRLETSLPWGFSILLAPCVALFGRHALALKVAAALMQAAGAGLFYAAVRERLSPPARPALLAALFFSGFWLSFSGAVMSEAGYLLLFGSWSWLALGRRWLWDSEPRRQAALALLAAFLTLTRVIGLALLTAALAELVLSGRLRQARRFGLTAAAALLPYVIAVKAASGVFTYFPGESLWPGDILAALRIPLSNAYYYLKGLSLLSFLNFPSFLPDMLWLKLPVLAALAAAAAAGLRTSARTPEGRTLAAYGLGYGVIVCCWPYQGPRFILPVLPLFALWFVTGLEGLVPSALRPRVLAAFCAAVLATNAGTVLGTARTSLSQAVDLPHESHLWLRENSRPDEPIVSMDIARIRYYAGRRGLHFIPSASAEEFAARARQLGARLFFIKDDAYTPTVGSLDPASAQQRRLTAYLERADLFTPVYRNDEEGVRIFASRAPLLP